MRMLNTAAASAVVLAVFAANAASAADLGTAVPVAATYPYLEGTLDLELGDNYVFQSDDPSLELNELYLKGELGLTLGLTEIFSINGGLTFEPVRDPRPFRDRTLGDHGLYVDTLNLQADVGQATFLAGKFEPAFGRAWDIAPGVFGTDFAEDYELAEQVGLSGSYAFQTGAWGTQTVTGALFFADRTFLSDSAFTRRGRLGAGDGGAGNTGRLDNFMVSLDGADMPWLPGFSYQIAYRHLSAGLGDVGDEDGFVASVLQEHEFGNRYSLGLLGEAAYFADYGGSGDDAVYVTAGLQVKKDQWHGELTGTLRHFELAAGGTRADHLLQASGGYEFAGGYDVSLGYGMSRDAGDVSHAVGLRLTKSFEFSTRAK